jgi:hypothetical protein
MKLNKETLKRIIKEEIDAIMNETMTVPPIGGGITHEQQVKIDDLINSGEQEYIDQARSLVDALGGNPTYVDTLLDMEYQGVTSMAHQQRDVIDSFPDYEDATDQDTKDFYNATSNYDGDARQKIADRHSGTPDTKREAGRRYNDTINSRIRK